MARCDVSTINCGAVILLNTALLSPLPFPGSVILLSAIVPAWPVRVHWWSLTQLVDTALVREGGRERERETETETDRQTDKQRHRDSERGERERGERGRERERQRQRHRERTEEKKKKEIFLLHSARL